MRLKISIIALAALFYSGCQGPGIGGSSSSWSGSQKEEFINILNEDRYSSVCDLQPMINQYKQTKDDKILTKLLYRYSENLANSCIDIPAFKRALRAKSDKAVYEVYEEYVSNSDIAAKLKSGASVDTILQAYAPATPQFQALINAYNASASPTEQYKIKLNIERTKILKPTGWDGTYIVVNVPEFKFRLYENGQKSLEFNVITGKPSWPTPIFSSIMKYITVNPTWNVPDNIARKEEIPKIIRDKSYLKRHNMVVKKDYGLDSPTVNPNKVNWKEYLKPEWANKDLPYKIIEQASKRNALGVVKFIFPNRHSVYMHDTPNKRLFSRQVRAFSHGCIRLQKPLKLLGHISTFYTTQNFDEVGGILKAKKTKYVNLKQKIPVHITYLTRYADDGMLIRGVDIYGYDKITKLKIPTTMVETAPAETTKK